MAGKVTIIVHSGDMDNVYSAFIVANGGTRHGDGSITFLHLLGSPAPQER